MTNWAALQSELKKFGVKIELEAIQLLMENDHETIEHIVT